MKHTIFGKSVRTAAAALFLALVMVVTLIGCGGGTEPAESASETQEVKLTVTLDFNGSGEEAKTLTCKPGETVELPAAAYEGYEFLGWSEEDGTVQKGSFLPTGDCTLKAQWSKLYTLTFAGTDEVRAIKAGDEIGKLPKTEAQENNIFCGWNTDENGTGDYFAKDTAMPEKDVTLYAVWKKGATISFDTAKSVFVVDGEAAGELPAGSKNGYKFISWNTAEDGSGETFTAESVVNGDIQLYGQFVEGGMVSFGNEFSFALASFNEASEIGCSGCTAPKVSYANESITFTITGDNVFLNPPARSMHLTAGHSYQINYNYWVDGMIGSNTRMTIMSNDAKGVFEIAHYMENATPGTEYTVVEGYEYIGLRPGVSGGSVDEVITYDHIYVLDVTDYAGASMPKLGDKEETSRIVALGEAIGELPVMEREGYTFTGWNTAKDGSGTAYTAETVVTDAAVQLWPQWTQN